MRRWGMMLAACAFAVLVASGAAQGHRPVAPARVRVSRGQTLWSIARTLAPADEDVRETVDRLARENGIGPGDVLAAGRVLRVGGGSVAVARAE